MGSLCMVDINSKIGFVFSGANTNVESIFSADANCEVLADYLYSAYGEVMMQSGKLAQKNPMRFSTRYAENTSLYYYGYRHYSPKLRKWTSTEPLGESESRNLNTFCKNNPIDFIDILGLHPVSWYNHHSNPTAAARARGKHINERSKKENVEYCGMVCKACVNKKYVYFTTQTTQNIIDTCKPDSAPCPSGSFSVAVWHTHGGDSKGKYDDENFSNFIDDNGEPNGDIPYADSRNQDIYLITPGNAFKQYIPGYGVINRGKIYGK